MVPADPMERHALLVEQLDGAPLLAGNKVEVLDGGVAMFEAAFRAIAGATDHVNLEFYILQDVRIPGTEGPSLFGLLLLKLAQGVAVTIIHDGYGSLGSDFGPLRAAGAQTLEFHPLDPTAAQTGWRPNDRDHRKMLIVDGRIGIMGGINLDHVYENPCGTGAPEPIPRPPAGTIPPSASRGRRSAPCRSSSSRPGRRSTARRCRRATGSPPWPRRGRRASGCWAARRGRSGRATTSPC